MLGLNALSDAYRGRRVLITGHTGFKGSWLALWLTQLGAKVAGVSLAPPTTPNHWDLLRLSVAEHRIDVRDYPAIARVVADLKPECIFHLAAQSLVRRSYAGPLDTWSTNVMGTANLLEACRSIPSVQAIVAVTTDKCYENDHRASPYDEDDRLGGHDPYSASKAAAELVASSYRLAFMSGRRAPLLATARAGNVMGGGDWAEDRLIPDLMRAQGRGEPLTVRSPGATRPWQHVLDCLAGYLQLGAHLLAGQHDVARAWNFGPESSDTRSVADLLASMQAHWPGLRWDAGHAEGPHEAMALSLNSDRAHQLLGWRPTWSFEDATRVTATWYRAFLESGNILSHDQLEEFCAASEKLVHLKLTTA
jgi:CDP-glucose 4,6-dehydratase